MIAVRGGRLLDAGARRADPADLLIDGDEIREVGPPGMAAPPGAQAVDATGMLLVPGLVNAHTHSSGNLTRGIGDRWTLELLVNAGPWLGGGRTDEEAHLSALLGAAEMLRRGCTACYDLVGAFPVPAADTLFAVGRAYEAAGMRAVVAPMVADLSLYEAIPGLREAVPDGLRADLERARRAPVEAALAAMREVVTRWPFDRDRVRPALAPTIPLLCSDRLLAGCRNLARELGVGLHTHVAESKPQAVASLERYGRSIVAHLDALGMLGPGFAAAHAVWVDGEDIARLADRGAAVAHNPGSNMALGSGLAPVAAMLERGVTVGLGTDGPQVSAHQNLFEVMRLASFGSKVQGPDYPRWVGADQAFAMATTGGAELLGFGGRIGRLAPGYKADVVFLDLHDLAYVPLNDVTNQVVHGESGAGVVRVMVGGRLVVDQRRLTLVDESRLPAMAEAAAARLRRVNAPLRRMAERLEPLVGRICRRLARRPWPINRYGAGDWLDTAGE